MNKRKQRNIIIGLLCGVVLLMGVGYAAFQTVLNINGTSNITSNWNIKIDSITSKNIVGTASNNGEPTFDNLSATFKTTLKSPGDSISYDVVIKNEGTIDSKLTKINLSDTNNEAITFTSSGLAAGESLLAGASTTLTVKVTYNSNVNTDPANKINTLTLSLDYEQKTVDGVEIGNNVKAYGQTIPVIETGDGLYTDTYEMGRYVYRGQTPNNNIMLKEGSADVLYRIIAIEPDGTLKVIRDEKVITSPWDVRTIETTGPRLNENNTYCQLYPDGKYYGCNAWSAVKGNYVNGSLTGTVTQDSTIKTYLNTTYYNTLDTATKSVISDHKFNIGGVIYNWGIGTGQSITELNTNEPKDKWTGKVGLTQVSDYFKSTTNSLCIPETNGYYNSAAGTQYPCKDNNYLYKSGYWWWTITPYLDNRRNAFHVSSTGYVNHYLAYDSGGVRPAFYLKSTINLLGDGTTSTPYKLK